MLAPGDRIADKFVVEALVGQGGLAEVYRVRHIELGKVSALKLLTWKSPRMADRLVQEGKIQARLQHPNVVSVNDIVRHDGQVGLIMDYVEHETLESYVGRHGALPIDEGLKLFAAILSAMAAAHGIGVLHRDIKPGNVMLAITPDGLVPKVADFGIAKALSEELKTGNTVEGTAMGSPGYLAPEQVLDASSVDERTDIFSLGVVLYEILTGVRAFADEKGNVAIVSTLKGDVTPIRARRPEVPSSVAAAIARAMSTDRNDRPSSVRAFAGELFTDFPDLLKDLAGTPRIRALNLEIAPPRDPMPTIAPRTGSPSGASSPSTGGGRAAPTLAPGGTVGSTLAPVGSEFLDDGVRSSGRAPDAGARSTGTLLPDLASADDVTETTRMERAPGVVEPQSHPGSAWKGLAVAAMVVVLVGGVLAVVGLQQEPPVSPPPRTGSRPSVAAPPVAVPPASEAQPELADAAVAPLVEALSGEKATSEPSALQALAEAVREAPAVADVEPPPEEPGAPRVAAAEVASPPPEQAPPEGDAAEPAGTEPVGTEPAGTEPGEAEPGETETATAAVGTEPIADPRPTEPPPEAATFDPRGTWTGKANNRTFGLDLETSGGTVTGVARFANPQGGFRNLEVAGTFDARTGAIKFSAEEFEFMGSIDASGIRGIYKPKGTNKSFAWDVHR